MQVHSPECVHAQSATTGLPERMCRANMKKNTFVLGQMRSVPDALTRGLSLDVLTAGHVLSKTGHSVTETQRSLSR